MRKILLILGAIVIGGCTHLQGTSGDVVPRHYLREFVTAAAAHDFDAMDRVGKAAFRRGLCIPDHALLFGNYHCDRINQEIAMCQYEFPAKSAPSGPGKLSAYAILVEESTGKILGFGQMGYVL